MYKKCVSFLFSGDFAPCRGFEKIVLEKKEKVFGDLRKDIVDADFSFVNLEVPLCLGGEPILKDGPNLRANPECIYSLKEAGFNVVCLANNHIMDYGESGLRETLGVCQKMGIRTCGAGESIIEAQKPLIVEKDGLKIAFIAVAEHEFSIASEVKCGAAPLDVIDNTKQIEQARKECDFVFVSIHGGNEYFPYPRPDLRKVCKFLVDRGADAVICHHAHVPGAYEFYKNKPIVYSLGNLVFDNLKPPEFWNEGYVFRAVYDKGDKSFLEHEVIPYTQSVNQEGISKMQNDAKQCFMFRINSYNKILDNKAEYDDVWNGFCQKKKSDVLIRMYSPFLFKGAGKIGKLIDPVKVFLPCNNTKLIKINMIRCESHFELLKNVLERL